jgi:TetR/AcrR family transcriptional regulator, transcriptional repressor for nem operon
LVRKQGICENGPVHAEKLRSADPAIRILDVAERLVQERGFNGFSYADVAAELGVTKASLHYHFAGKAELGEALIERYADRFRSALAVLDGESGDARVKLDGYAELYGDVLRAKRMCLCGMLAAEYGTLPAQMQAAVLRFFDGNESWLEGVLEAGREAQTLAFAGPARETARFIIGALEGAMLVARPYGDVRRFQSAASALLAGVAGTRSTRA